MEWKRVKEGREKIVIADVKTHLKEQAKPVVRGEVRNSETAPAAKSRQLMNHIQSHRDSFMSRKIPTYNLVLLQSC